MKVVFAIIDDNEKKRSYWQRIGVAFDNKDGSLNVLLNCVPLSGRVHIRMAEESDSEGKSSDEAETHGGSTEKLEPDTRQQTKRRNGNAG